jgi:hypothetical protein
MCDTVVSVPDPDGTDFAHETNSFPRVLVMVVASPEMYVMWRETLAEDLTNSTKLLFLPFPPIRNPERHELYALSPNAATSKYTSAVRRIAGRVDTKCYVRSELVRSLAELEDARGRGCVGCCPVPPNTQHEHLITASTMHAIDQQVFGGAGTLWGCNVLTLCCAVDNADTSTQQVFGWTNTNSPTL